MDTKATLIAAALTLIEEEGEAQFSTRAVCAAADVKAPTLYHHFGSADGLLSAAIAEAFAEFLRGKRTAVRSDDPVTALAEGWDNYVRFAAARPRLYAAMMARVMLGADIPAAREGQALLAQRIAAIAPAGRLAMPPAEAARVAWASANAAAMLFVAAVLQSAMGTGPPDEATVLSLRDGAIRTICKAG
ncbi:MAG TPA: helix-turn-helix domain-containing protein [Bauldia sp.]|nr:helix-turn-helix domain-containing protein [Bauldia sp.]